MKLFHQIHQSSLNSPELTNGICPEKAGESYFCLEHPVHRLFVEAMQLGPQARPLRPFTEAPGTPTSVIGLFLTNRFHHR